MMELHQLATNTMEMGAAGNARLKLDSLVHLLVNALKLAVLAFAERAVWANMVMFLKAAFVKYVP